MSRRATDETRGHVTQLSHLQGHWGARAHALVTGGREEDTCRGRPWKWPVCDPGRPREPPLGPCTGHRPARQAQWGDRGFLLMPLRGHNLVSAPPERRGRKVQKEGKISYADFVWFLISEEDKKTPTRWGWCCHGRGARRSRLFPEHGPGVLRGGAQPSGGIPRGVGVGEGCVPGFWEEGCCVPGSQADRAPCPRPRQHRVLVPLHGPGRGRGAVHVRAAALLRGAEPPAGGHGHRGPALRGLPLPDAGPGAARVRRCGRRRPAGGRGWLLGGRPCEQGALDEKGRLWGGPLEKESPPSTWPGRAGRAWSPE